MLDIDGVEERRECNTEILFMDTLRESMHSRDCVSFLVNESQQSCRRRIEFFELAKMNSLRNAVDLQKVSKNWILYELPVKCY